ncbi:MAG: hypothetical protein ACI80F_002362 [Natronomonas sp.]|jgi:hypothetical protein|uniref:hypothetical protein n=1 Tax=Natronomonas sp. TaxID=2184060 RepID=UPI003988AB82
MITRESGYLNAARFYLRDYGFAFIAVSLYIIVLSGLSLAGVIMNLEGALHLYTLALVSTIAHLAAITIHDIWVENIDVESAMELGPNREAALLSIGLLGIYLNVLLFGTAFVASMAGSLPTLIVFGLALYMPIGDLILLRNVGWSPAGLSIIATAYLLVFIGLMRDVSIADLPIIGNKNPRQPT